MTRPLIPVALALLLGVWFESWRSEAFSPLFPSFASFIFAAYILLLVAWLFAHLNRRDRAASLCLLLLAFLTGMTRYAVVMRLPANHLASLMQDEIVTIEGYLYKPPETLGVMRRLYVETTILEKDGLRYNAIGRARITLTNESLPNTGRKRLAYGDTLRARLRLAPPKNRDNDFDYQEFMARRGIYRVGSLRSDRNLVLLPEKQGNPMMRQLYHAQARMLVFLSAFPQKVEYTPPPLDAPRYAIQVIQAMTIGASYVLHPDLRSSFRHSGMYHILVISGIHVAILAGVFHVAFKLLGVPWQARNVILGVVLLLYAGITGFQYPVMRSVCMALIFYASYSCNRMSDALYSLWFTVTLFVMLDPNALFDVSLQLTVAATAGILLAFRHWSGQTWFQRLTAAPKWRQAIAMSLLSSAAALLGVTPLMMYHFKQITPFSLISTPLSLPLVTAMLPLSLLVCFGALLPQAVWPLLKPLLWLDVWLSRLLIKFSELFPAINFTVEPPLWFGLPLYYLLLYLWGTGGLKLVRRTLPDADESRSFRAVDG
ncbi:metallo-beta-lactamase superfamily [Candidatus Moduliflexus flocculans]|uniref:Metallo-beta-lactamase superfamily n=1 Tax=Candidatus Moduliflexus flocculans TaxID=1499966 RepID=A0A081BT77_9BACT|nr:metallo-beta-lactamase superfamily [Candidatus Moduliflexus flocculans]